MPNIALTNRIMQIHLSSWRYFAFLTLPPLGIAFNSAYSLQSVLLLILFFISHYFCWRLWLDERLFLLLDNEGDLASFDEGMAYLWPMKQDKTRTLAERWLGARRLFRRAMFATLALWAVALITLLYPS
ncbi:MULTISPECIES: hypothetical protein [unclassified Brenneria]|uniref:hypothetical protein n=1 Tax=unclassified Brenneria TaxID=2634434 RepID=UPI0029C58411|nr:MULTISPECIES: hypothetical protein [unclassified Brenneria]MDX5629863.1 hypothetical protein [Brenneria sp. L3-3Z]MDX5697009.1 hypothetical protein [Brenneria sp. L4-2C]